MNHIFINLFFFCHFHPCKTFLRVNSVAAALGWAASWEISST